MKTNEEKNMKFEIYSSSYINNPQNCLYPNKFIVKDETSAKEAFSHDYVCAKYTDNYRSIDTFQSTSTISFDIDNDHTEDEFAWITPDVIATEFKDLSYIIHFSRNNLKEKKGRKPRPKFHIIFISSELTSADAVRDLKLKFYEFYPYVDKNALDAGRFMFGTHNPEIIIHEGIKTLDEHLLNKEKSIDFLADDSIPEGSRNATMLKIAVSILKRDGNTEATRELYRKNVKRCNPPLSTSELNTIWKQALKYYGEIQKQPDYQKPEDYGKESFDEIIPLPDVVLPNFPINVLAPSVRDYCLEVAESTQTPPDMAFVSALAILALAMQKNYKVVGKTDWEEQLSLYVMIVAEPSDRKSAVLNQMVKVIHAFEANYNNSHQTELQKNHDEYNRLKNHKAKILKDLENNKATQEDYDAVVDKLVNFKLLNSLNLTLDDVTTESIAENMSTQNGCISIVSSEGGMVDIISGLYSKLVNLDIYLKGYSGDSLKVDRIGRDSLYIPNPRLTILLTVQPKVLENFITNPTFEGRGLTARFLYSIPKSLVGSRKFNTEPIKYESKQAFISLVNEILNESGQATTYIHLSDEATTLLEEYHNKFELRLATDLKEMGSWAGKLLGNILRLSAIITRARGIKYDEFLGCKPSTDDSAVWIVQKDDMANAIKVGEYFLEHAECAFNLLGVDQKTKDAKTLIKVIKEHKPELTEVNARIIARITSKIGKKDRILPVLSMLADYGYLKEKQQTYVAGRPRSETYLVNPKIYIDDGEPP